MNTKQIRLFLIVISVFAGFILAGEVFAAQNSNYPSPSKCNGADWTIGLPNSTTCTGSITIGASHSLNQDSKVQSILGANSRVNPDLASMNQLCRQYTGDSSSYATSGSVHNYCSGCDQKIASWTGSSWVVSTACAGTLNMQKIVCSTNCGPTCTTNYTKKCVGSSTVYWYDSCGNKGNLYETCSSGKTCVNGECVNVECSNNSDCGTNGYTGLAYCSGGNVYQDYTTYTCNNAGTTSSHCSDATVAKLKSTCSSSQTCSNGSCVNVNIECSSNSDCGTSGWTGSAYCSGGNVYQNYTTYACNNSGTASSYCSNSTDGKLKTTCSSSQTCSNGSCGNITCNSNSDCGSDGYTGSAFCSGGDVYKTYKTYTCNNAGTTSSHCSNTTTDKLIDDCSSSQTCSNGSCNNQNIACDSNSDCGSDGYTGSAFCSGGDVYKTYKTYTCNNAGTASSYCSNSTENKLYDNCSSSQTCSNGSCSDDNDDDSNTEVTTKSADNIDDEGATLNGYLDLDEDVDDYAYVWFQYGTSTSYGHSTSHVKKNSSGSFDTTIDIDADETYYFRAVAKTSEGVTVYGSRKTFDSDENNNSEDNSISITKTVKNMTTGSGFSSYVYANPGDTLMFMIKVENTGDDTVENIEVKDTLSSGLIYDGNMVVSGTNDYSGKITTGLEIDSIDENDEVTITYLVQVADSSNFGYGVSTETSKTKITGDDLDDEPSKTTSVTVTKTAVYGATTISTGLTNNFLTDSFLLPLLIALAGIWMFRTGMFANIETWFDRKKKNRTNLKAEKQLAVKIAEIQKAENK